MLEILNREHPDYRDRKEMWQRYWDFYVGGEQLRRNAALYIVRRQKEPNDVYAERLSRVFYENYLGSCVDWYASSLFRNHPVIRYETRTPGTGDFIKTFLSDCDCRGSSLVELARKAFIQTLIFQESYALIDFPRVEQVAATRAEEDEIGKSRAYVVGVSPLDVINWRKDDQGEFEWVLLRTERAYQAEFSSQDTVRERRWLYFDRENYRTYRHLQREAGSKAEAGEVELVDEGRHALSSKKKVPLVKMAVSDGLWLANKAALLQQEHFNKSNGLSWALHMGLFAMPVIYSEREWQQIVGEAYYIQLGPDDRFGWTEPEGHVFQIAADNLDRLKDEIYRVCYLMTQSGGREARNLGQSGESKRRDFAVTHEVLRSYGQMTKDFVRRVLKVVAEARQDDVQIAVSGMDEFEGHGFEEELQQAIGLRQLGIRSPKFEQEMQKRVVLKYLEESGQDVREQVLREIEGAA